MKIVSFFTVDKITEKPSDLTIFMQFTDEMYTRWLDGMDEDDTEGDLFEMGLMMSSGNWNSYVFTENIHKYELSGKVFEHTTGEFIW